MIAKITKHGDAAAAAMYVFKDGKDAELVDGNAGSNPADIANAFEVLKGLNPRVDRNVLHISLSLAEGETLTEGQWERSRGILFKQLGVEPSKTRWVEVAHHDTDHEHRHYLVSRVGIDGSCLSDSKDFQRAETACRQVEKIFGLHQVEPGAYAVKPDRKQSPKHEREFGTKIRIPKGEALTQREFIQSMVDKVLIRSPIASFDDFQARLAGRGVAVEQRGSGYTFAVRRDEPLNWFKGSELGNAYSGKALTLRIEACIEATADGGGDSHRSAAQELTKDYRQQHRQERNARGGAAIVSKPTLEFAPSVGTGGGSAAPSPTQDNAPNRSADPSKGFSNDELANIVDPATYQAHQQAGTLDKLRAKVRGLEPDL